MAKSKRVLVMKLQVVNDVLSLDSASVTLGVPLARQHLKQVCTCKCARV